MVGRARCTHRRPRSCRAGIAQARLQGVRGAEPPQRPLQSRPSYTQSQIEGCSLRNSQGVPSQSLSPPRHAVPSPRQSLNPTRHAVPSPIQSPGLAQGRSPSPSTLPGTQSQSRPVPKPGGATHTMGITHNIAAQDDSLPHGSRMHAGARRAARGGRGARQAYMHVHMGCSCS